MSYTKSSHTKYHRLAIIVLGSVFVISVSLLVGHIPTNKQIQASAAVSKISNDDLDFIVSVSYFSTHQVYHYNVVTHDKRLLYSTTGITPPTGISLSTAKTLSIASDSANFSINLTNITAPVNPIQVPDQFRSPDEKYGITISTSSGSLAFKITDIKQNTQQTAMIAHENPAPRIIGWSKDNKHLVFALDSHASLAMIQSAIAVNVTTLTPTKVAQITPTATPSAEITPTIFPKPTNTPVISPTPTTRPPTPTPTLPLSPTASPTPEVAPTPALPPSYYVLDVIQHKVSPLEVDQAIKRIKDVILPKGTNTLYFLAENGIYTQDIQSTTAKKTPIPSSIAQDMDTLVSNNQDVKELLYVQGTDLTEINSDTGVQATLFSSIATKAEYVTPLAWNNSEIVYVNRYRKNAKHELDLNFLNIKTNEMNTTIYLGSSTTIPVSSIQFVGWIRERYTQVSPTHGKSR